MGLGTTWAIALSEMGALRVLSRGGTGVKVLGDQSGEPKSLFYSSRIWDDSAYSFIYIF